MTIIISLSLIRENKRNMSAVQVLIFLNKTLLVSEFEEKFLISPEQSMHAMNCKTDNFEASDINNFTVVRARIWQSWHRRAKCIGFSFSIITARLTSSQPGRWGECSVKKIPRLIVEVVAAQKYTTSLISGSEKP
jgi:hypothetical protein